MADWKIGDKCYICMYGSKYGEVKFLIYESNVVESQRGRFNVEVPAMLALRARYELYKTKEQAEEM
jgi:hypothetical protein